MHLAQETVVTCCVARVGQHAQRDMHVTTSATCATRTTAVDPGLHLTALHLRSTGRRRVATTKSTWPVTSRHDTLSNPCIWHRKTVVTCCVARVGQHAQRDMHVTTSATRTTAVDLGLHLTALPLRGTGRRRDDR